ncbi:MAG: hypothetical protein ACREL5_03300, partial [Gemmatimonadales bacterium]
MIQEPGAAGSSTHGLGAAMRRSVVWPAQPARAIADRLASGCAIGVLLLLVACGSSSGTDAGSGDATLSGTIEAAGTSATLEGATISVGTQQATSDANGHFELTGLAEGAATI